MNYTRLLFHSLNKRLLKIIKYIKPIAWNYFLAKFQNASLIDSVLVLSLKNGILAVKYFA